LVQAKVFKNQKAITDYAIDDSESDSETGEQENELKEDLESENSDNLVEVTETSPCAEDEEVNELADDLQETQLEESEVVDKPVKKGRKKN
jgi:hypothetical protein